MRNFRVFITLISLMPVIAGAVPTELSTFFRSGQTFITWREDGSENYKILRHSEPITEETRSSAEEIAKVDSNSSKSLFGVGAGIDQTHWIIDPIAENHTGLGSELSDDQGLFVHTTKETEGRFYYAVISDDNKLSGNVTGPIDEQKMRISPIPIYRVDGNSDTKDPSQGGMDDNTNYTTFAFFMDYSIWNHEWEGYIFNFIVSIPKNLESKEAWSICHRVDGKGTRLGNYISYSGSKAISILNESVSPSYPKTTVQDWHYGHMNAARDSVVNYTEYRNILSILYVIENLRGDRERVWGYGHSMGGSGSLSLGMRYPSLISMIYGCQPATDYGNTEFNWHGNVSASYGSREDNLPIVNLPFNHPDFPELDNLQKYNGTPVYDWQNPRKQLDLRVGDDMALLCLTHGRRDVSIDWNTQGSPFVGALLNSKRPFKYIVNESGHNWQSFNAINYTQLWHDGQRYGSWFDFPVSTTMPGFSGIDIAEDTAASYLVKAQWKVIQDEQDVWEMEISSVGEICKITPRRCHNFYANPGDKFEVFLNDLKAGEVTADGDGLVTTNDLDLTETGVVKLVNSYRAPTSVTETTNGILQRSRLRNISDGEKIRVQYQSSAAGSVSFSLFDSRGRVVGDIQNISLQNGTARAEWNHSSPGIYFVRASGSAGVVTEKLMWK